MTTEISLEYKILDNVHGFIGYTKAEDQIMNLLPFKRLQSIKQQSLVNWVFPGSEHTRYIHSLGVMHIADRIALKLGLSAKERKIVRFAGLLHDIGHYPLSHVCENPYRYLLEIYPPDNYCSKVNESVSKKIADFTLKPEIEFMRAAKPGHHEEIGALVIKNNEDIRKIIIDECDDEDAVDIICDMITGNVEKNFPNIPLLVQILHSDLDADGIDYMLRDAVYSGTSFGSFELDQLIDSLECKDYNGKPILCINPKGIAAADQYLINKFFSYSQVVYNKHTSILEWMAVQIVSWMQEINAYFPCKITLRNEWLKEAGIKKFLAFTDNFFWSAVRDISNNPTREALPPYILSLCDYLLIHQELKFVEDSEIKIVSNNCSQIHEIIESTGLVAKITSCNDKITVFNHRGMTKHVPYNEYINQLKKPTETDEEMSDEEFARYKKDMNTLRLMEGICVADNDNLHLLCDDTRSLMQQLYSTQLVIYRAYEFPG